MSKPLDEQTVIETNMLLSTVRTLLNKGEATEIMKLKYRNQNLRGEIKRLTDLLEKKVYKAGRDGAQNVTRGSVKVGDTISDGFGRPLVITSIGASGIVDQSGQTHYWHHVTLESPAPTPEASPTVEGS